jgi:hypothetical protein
MQATVEQTKEEKMAMYMKLSKKQIIEMLIESQLSIDLLKSGIKPYEEAVRCDKCGCRPNVIWSTDKGMLCINCKD